MQFEGKKIIVTGGSQGIGEAAVREFAARGALVTSIDLNEETGNAVAESATAEGPGKVTFIRGDVTDRAGIDKAFDTAAQQMGGLDALINIAGIQQSSFAAEITDELFDKIYRVNVLGTIISNQAAYRLMKPNKSGSIVNVGSMAGFVPELTNAAYGSSKAAVHAWVRGVSREWGGDNIRVNAVLPYVNTPMFDKYRSSLSPDELVAYDKSVADAIPLGHVGNAREDLAPAIAFLASDDARFITGQLLPVDGGLANVR
ncbi:SDR family oxidoreductase [Cryobacterium sp. BB307]|uniref:SDR family NAD(P)-dependent oxidoreductase n=1 Tax=Cryobacterium sp. BB307 TaxID=2716317 RepID=UPI0014483F4D|nr:SDR family oxidoreductase [Cryobacterium sp. BB307]